MNLEKILVLSGDGIGPSVTASAEAVIRAAVGDEVEILHGSIGQSAYESTGSYLPHETLDLIDECKVIISGPTAVPENVKDPLEQLKIQLDLFSRCRWFKTFSPDLGIEGMDVTLWSSNNYIKDEITEVTDFDGVTLSKYVRAKAYSRMMGVAYSNIDKRNLDHILCLVRDDFFPISSKMFSDSFNELFASDDRETRVLNVRDWVSRIFKDPLHDDCIICVDLYNQIVAGVLAGLCGNPDLYPSLYRGSDYSLFIPNESSSKEGFEEGYANPTAAIVSAAMILSDLGMRDASRKVTDALSGTYVAGERTPDVGGTLTTEEFTQRVISRL